MSATQYCFSKKQYFHKEFYEKSYFTRIIRLRRFIFKIRIPFLKLFVILQRLFNPTKLHRVPLITLRVRVVRVVLSDVHYVMLYARVT